MSASQGTGMPMDYGRQRCGREDWLRVWLQRGMQILRARAGYRVTFLGLSSLPVVCLWGFIDTPDTLARQ